MYVGALAYADGVTFMLAPSLRTMRFLLQICEQYGWVFNTEKSACLHDCIRLISVLAEVHSLQWIASKIENVCTAWRKGLRRMWDLRYRTHSRLLAPIYGFLPVKDQWICHSTSFIVKCLASGNDVIQFVTRNGKLIYFRRMLSNVGRNAEFCCAYYGLIPE